MYALTRIKGVGRRVSNYSCRKGAIFETRANSVRSTPTLSSRRPMSISPSGTNSREYDPIFPGTLWANSLISAGELTSEELERIVTIMVSAPSKLCVCARRPR